MLGSICSELVFAPLRAARFVPGLGSPCAELFFAPLRAARFFPGLGSVLCLVCVVKVSV